MAFRFMACCCGGKWFDFYCHPHTGQGSVTIRTPSVCPPNTGVDTYNSEDDTPPWVLASGAAPASSLASPAAFGDYFLWIVGSFSSSTFSLYSNSAGSSGPVNLYTTATQTNTPIALQGRYTFDDNAGMRRDHYSASAGGNQWGIYWPYDKKPALGPAGHCHVIKDEASLGRSYKEIDETGSITTNTKASTDFTDATERGDQVVRSAYYARTAFPWACGIKLTPSTPGSGVVRFTWTIATGEADTDTSICDETNVVVALTEDVAVTPGGEAAAVAAFFTSATNPTIRPTDAWTVSFYDRSPTGDEIVRLARYQAGGLSEGVNSTFTPEEYRWYCNGNLIDSSTTASDEIITSSIAVSPDPALSTATKFVITEDNGSTITDVVGLDEDGVEVWRVEGTTAPSIIAASDRYVYVSSFTLNNSTETGGRVSTSGASDWMIRLDGDQNFPFLAHSGTSQIGRGSKDFNSFDCIKNSDVPLSVDIDILAQWDGHQGV